MLEMRFVQEVWSVLLGVHPLLVPFQRLWQFLDVCVWRAFLTVEFWSNKSVVSPSICASYHLCRENILAVPLLGDDGIYDILLFILWVHLNCFAFDCLSEYWVGHQQVMLSTFTLNKQSNEVRFPSTLPFFYVSSLSSLLANSGIKNSQQ